MVPNLSLASISLSEFSLERRTAFLLPWGWKDEFIDWIHWLTESIDCLPGGVYGSRMSHVTGVVLRHLHFHMTPTTNKNSPRSEMLSDALNGLSTWTCIASKTCIIAHAVKPRHLDRHEMAFISTFIKWFWVQAVSKLFDLSFSLVSDGSSSHCSSFCDLVQFWLTKTCNRKLWKPKTGSSWRLWDRMRFSVTTLFWLYFGNYAC